MTVAREKDRWRGGQAGPSVSDGRSNGAPPSDTPRPSDDVTADAILPGRRLLRKARGKDWRTHYRLSVEIGFGLSVLLLVALVRAPLNRSSDSFEISLAQQEVVTIEEIQQTKQPEKAPPPPRPPVPVEVADDSVIDDDNLDLDVTLDIGEMTTFMPPPPEPVEEDEPEENLDEIFVVVEEMPQIIGGAGKIYEYLEYPPIARQAQMEGLVIVGVVVEADGSGTNWTVIKSAGKVLDDAAIEAVKKLRYKPGKQRGRAVRVKLALPIRFMLRDRTS